MALGAEGVQMGSRFLTTKECHVHDKYKQAIVDAKDTDTTITRRKLGLRVRSLKNEFTLHLEDMDRSGATAEDIQSYMGFGTAREGMMDGDAVKGDMLVGQMVGMISEVMPASDVVRQVIAEATAIVERCNQLHQA
jgi:enoyl-[acyl-carrier protein] reductase II